MSLKLPQSLPSQLHYSPDAPPPTLNGAIHINSSIMGNAQQWHLPPKLKWELFFTMPRTDAPSDNALLL